MKEFKTRIIITLILPYEDRLWIITFQNNIPSKVMGTDLCLVDMVAAIVGENPLHGWFVCLIFMTDHSKNSPPFVPKIHWECNLNICCLIVIVWERPSHCLFLWETPLKNPPFLGNQPRFLNIECINAFQLRIFRFHLAVKQKFEPGHV